MVERRRVGQARGLRLGAEDHVILLTVHHIVSDDWSSNVLLQELVRLYRAFAAGQLSAAERDASPRICTWLRIESVEGLAYDPSMQKFATEEEIIENAVEQSDSSEKIVTVFLPEHIAQTRAGYIIRSVQSQVDKPLHLVSDNLPLLTAALHHVTGTPAISSPAGDKSALLAIASKYGAVVI